MGVTVLLEVNLDPTASPEVWTDITSDLVGELEIDYGIQGQGPTDNTASSGTCTFTLLNHPVRQYSPLHTDVLTGWTIGTPVRVTLSDETVSPVVSAVKHRGKVRMILPVAGDARERTVEVQSDDGIRDLAEADVREIALQINQQEDDLFTAILGAIPATSQPISTSIDTGLDTFPVAFHDVGAGLKALTLIHDVATASYSLAYMRGDGQFTTLSRSTRSTVASSYTFAASELTELDVPARLGGLYNLVRVRIRPTTIDAAATTILWASTGDPIEVASGETLTIWAEYRDPSNQQVALIGGQDVVNPLVENTHYDANTAADGTGTDISADQTVTITPFASSAKLELTNANASTAYYVDSSGNNLLEVVGKGIYDLGAETYEAEMAKSYGTRPLTIELRYQRSGSFAQNYADNVSTVWADLVAQIQSLTFVANSSAALMAQAITGEPSDVVTVSEEVTGVDERTLVVHRVRLTVAPAGILTAEYGLATSSTPFDSWLLGVVGRGELGTNTKLGF